MKQKYKGQKPDREVIVFILFIAVMIVYYGWRMFALTPWYDELYTYYYFISRGPVYAAIHWPLPNNHIGYSVLSACLGFLGNASIALRGVSYLCSIGSLILIFRIGRRWFEPRMALIPVFLYASMHMVNQLAVQGRGYALVAFCYLAAVYELLHITQDSDKCIPNYVIFGISLVMALYAIPSSVYVVVPVCLVGGVTLLVQRDYSRLLWLVLTSLASAVCTVGLYGIVWLAIGSNLLVKTEGSAYYGLGHGTVILQDPFAALKTGIDYMLATPYIQSVGRDGFFGKFADWLRNLLNGYYTGGALILAILIITSVIFSAASMIKKWPVDNLPDDRTKRHQRGGLFRDIYLTGSFLCIPVMLIVQCSLPYYRVFSFVGVTVAFALTWVWQTAVKCLFSGSFPRLKQYIPMAGSLFSGLLCSVLLFSPSYRAQYSEREAAIADAYSQLDLAQIQTIAVTDCDQEYLLLFLYGIGEERLTKVPGEGQIVLADKYLLLGYQTEISDWSGDDWKLYLSPEEFEDSAVTGQMQAVYENDRFVMFMK